MYGATLLLSSPSDVIICCVDPHPLCNFMTLVHISVYGNRPPYNLWSPLIAGIAIRGGYDAGSVFRCDGCYVVYSGGLCGWRGYWCLGYCCLGGYFVLGVEMCMLVV